MSNTEVDEETVAATKELITEKLSQNGELEKMQAMIISAALKALNDEDPGGDNLFTRSPALIKEKSSEAGKTSLSLVADYLRSLGLLYTANVFELETGCTPSALTSRADLSKKLNLDAVPKDAPLLNSILSSGAKVPSAAVSSTAATSVTQPTTTAAKPQAATTISKEGVSAGVAAVLAKQSTTPSTSAQVAPQNPKSKETPYYISNWKDREFERNGQVKGQQVAIEDLKNCKVFVYDAVDSITMDACENCELVVAACEGSIFIRECKDVKITAACKQLRFRDSSYCDVYLFASTDPVVESSHHIVFYPFNAQTPKLQERFKEARLDPTANRFVHVYDFTEEDPQLPKPHFTVKYTESVGTLKLNSFGTHLGAVECPPEIKLLLEGKLKPAASSESGSNKSQNIKTGGQLWNKSSEDGEDSGAGAPKPSSNAPSSSSAASKAAPSALAPLKSAPAPKTSTTPSATTSAPPAAKPSTSSPSKKDDSDSYSSFEDDDEF